MYPEYKQHVRYPLVSDDVCEADEFIDYWGISPDIQQCAGYEDHYIVACAVSRYCSISHAFLAVQC